MIEQLRLLSDEVIIQNLKDDSNSIPVIETKKEIFVYVIEDVVTQKKYIGISAVPLARIASHYSGKGSRDLYNDILARKTDFKETILGSFNDPTFSNMNTQSLAHHVEALMIAFYDSINNGYNTKYYIDADFENEEFWLSILPDSFKKFYINSNKKQLNINIQDYLPSKYIMRLDDFKSPKLSNDAKELYRKHLQLMIDKKIPVIHYAKNLCNINRSQINRFMRGMNGALRLNRIENLIDRIEEYLDIAHRFDIKKELKDYLNGETEG